MNVQLFFNVSFNRCSLPGNMSSVSLPNEHNVKEGIVLPIAPQGYRPGSQKQRNVKLEQEERKVYPPQPIRFIQSFSAKPVVPLECSVLGVP